MTTHVEAVQAYLNISGPQTLDQLWNGMDRRLSQTEIRKALKTLDCGKRTYGDFPKYTSTGELARITWKAVTYRKFTVYYLPDRGPRVEFVASVERAA